MSVIAALDLVQIKNEMSKKYLSRGFKSNVVASLPTMSMARAVEQADSNVHAVGIGRKVSDGVVTEQIAIRLYVVQKIGLSNLPKKSVLPKSIDGIPTDIIESSPAFFNARASRAVTAQPAAASVLANAIVDCTRDRQKRQRPTRAGISAAHPTVTAGTIGCFCRSTKAGDDPAKTFLLSNNHVFANVNQAATGDAIYQPGPADGGGPTDLIARLTRFKHISLSNNRANAIDAAIAELEQGIEWTPEICMIGAIDGVARATEGMRVRKHGRTSGYTEGVVVDEAYDALVGMDHANPNIVARFTNQMRIEAVAPYPAIGLGGDSGSLVVMGNSQKGVGLYFAGPQAGDYGIANHIEDVLSGLEIALVT